MKTALMYILIGCGTALLCSAAESPSCPPMSESDGTRLVNYVQKKYNVPATTAVVMHEVSRLDGSCFRRLLFSADGVGRPFRVELYASPDLRFLTRDLLDSTLDPAEEARYQARVMQAALNQEGGPSIGPKNAPVTLVLFSDFQCPFCSQMAAGLRKEILPAEGDGVRLVFRNYPLAMHPWARLAAEGAACARVQDEKYFWPIHDYIFEHQRELNVENVAAKIAARASAVDSNFDWVRMSACLDKKDTAAVIADDVSLGQQLKIGSTPTLFVNGVRVSGYVPTQIRTLIREQIDARKETAKAASQ